MWCPMPTKEPWKTESGTILLFSYPSGGKELKISKGMWYAYEDRYVYSNSIYVKTLHKFYDYLSMENIIYTKSAIEEPPILPYVY